MSLCIPTRQQVQDTDGEDQTSDLLNDYESTASSSLSDFKLEQGVSLSPPPYASAQTNTSVTVGTTPLHAPAMNNVTARGSQSYHHLIRTNPRSDSWSPAGTRIPPELFDNILLHLFLGYNPYGRDRSIPVLRAVKACSLVCRRWADLCREALFHNKELIIYSSEEAQTLIKYATQGCPSLVPMHKLIRSISVEQGYDMRHSFCDRVYMLKAKFGVRLSLLTFVGPVPEGFPSCKLDTPHWSLPPSVPTPPSLLSYDKIKVLSVHLPSFRHVVKYVRHFAQAWSIRFESLTWDADGQEPQLPFYRRGSSKVKDMSLRVDANGCTDNMTLCLLAVTVHSCWRSLTHMLPDNESQWITITIGELRELWGKNNDPCALEVWGPEESEELPISVISAESDPAWNFRFLICNLAAENTQTSDVHVVGVTFVIDEAEEKVDVDSLIPYLGHFPMLRVALISFYSYKGLLAAMEHNRPLSFNPLPVNGQGCTYMFTCEHRDDNEFPEVPRVNGLGGYNDVEIDPITLSPTGQSWAYVSDFQLSKIRESLRQTGHIVPPALT